MSDSTRLVVRRVIPADPSRLYEAWTTPSHLLAWWGPKGVRCTYAEVDPRVGGLYRLDNRFPDERVVVITGEFLVVEAPTKLVYTWSVNGAVTLELVTVRTQRLPRFINRSERMTARNTCTIGAIQRCTTTTVSLRGLVDAHDESLERVLLGEIHCFDLEEWVTHYGQKQDELHLPFNFGLLNVPWSASAVRELVNALEAALPEGAWPTYVLGNHDEPRLATRLGPSQARVAAMLLLTLRGTPTLYYGDELGMTDVVVPPELSHDPQGKRMRHLSRDPARSPMLWSTSENAGFCVEGVHPWLPLNPRVPSVSEQEVDRSSLLSLYRELLALRRTELALFAGDYLSLDAPDGVYAFERGESGGERLRILLNFTGDELECDLVSGSEILSTYLDGREGAASVHLRPHEGLILRPE